MSLWSSSGFRRPFRSPQLPLLLPILLLAVSVPATAKRYSFRTYGIGDGLPTAVVWDVEQDRTGCMWFATRTGVVSYDGLEWTVYEFPGSYPFRVGPAYLTRDDRDDLWAVGERAGEIEVARFDGTAWRGLPVESRDGFAVTSAAVVRGGEQPWILLAVDDSALLLRDASGWRSLDVARAGVELPIHDLETVDGHVLVAAANGIRRIDPDAPDVLSPVDGSPVREILDVDLDPVSHRLWLIGRDWVGDLADGEFTLRAEGLSFVLSEARVQLSCVADGFGSLYVGNRLGVYRLDPEGDLEPLDHHSGLVGAGMTGFHRDREGNVWISGMRGVSKLWDLRWASYSSGDGLLYDEVSAALQKSNGGIVLGHPHGGFTLLSEPVRTVQLPEDPLTLGRVLLLTEGPNGSVWAAGSELGLIEIGPEGDVNRYGAEHGLPGTVSAIVFDHSGRLWVGGGNTVYVREGGLFRPLGIPFPVDLTGCYLRRLGEDSEGRMHALFSQRGAFRLDGSSWTFLHSTTNPYVNDLYAMLARENGKVWYGSAAGLVEQRGDELAPAGDPAPDVRRPTYFLLRDDRQRVWLGTDDGVYVWDGTALDHFTVHDGLVGRETNRGAGFVDDQGNVWIGTDKGISVYRPGMERPRRAPLTVEVLAVEEGGREFPPDDPLAFPHDENTLQFRFRAISFGDEARIRYRTRLEGFDAEWSPTLDASTRRVRYTNLPPATYRFEVQACGADGIWATTSSAPITVRRPYWLSPWFVVPAILIVLATIYAVAVRISAGRYARRLREERREKEELRLQGELAKARRLEALGILAGGIAHDFNNLLQVILGNLSIMDTRGETGEVVAEVRSAAVRARALTNQLLTFSKGGAPVRKTASMADVIRESAAFILRGSNVRCEVDLPDDLRVVEIDGNQMSRVINNLLLNGKQSMPGAGVIRIRGRNVDTVPEPLPPGPYVLIEVSDEGIGIPRGVQERIFDPYFSTKDTGTGLGLATAYSIVSRHDGLLTVDSKPGRGSTFSLYLPASTRTLDVRKEGGTDRRPLRPRRILVMDDDEGVRATIAHVLESGGHRVDIVNDGEAAVRRYGEALANGARYDVIVMDLTIPGAMGGREAVERVLELDPDACAIVVSGYSNDPVLSDHARYGFRACVAKPFGASELEDALRIALAEPPD